MSKHKCLSKESILGCDDLPSQEVNIPEWGGSVWVKTMSGADRERFETAHQVEAKAVAKSNTLRARLAVYSVCDETGKAMFEEKDIPALAKKSGAALDRIFEVSLKLNKIGSEDISELEGESKASP
jgi:hypothetical protein